MLHLSKSQIIFVNSELKNNERIKELADSVGLGVRHDGIVLTKHVNAAV
jgi:hypothetical protein